MPNLKLHADEADIDIALVRRLVSGQFPAWADLPLHEVVSLGTDNAMYRLGEDMAVRLPRIPSSAAQVEKEQRWLPKLAPSLPLQVPVPVGKGSPGEGYPWNWSVYQWLGGVNATREQLSDLNQAAADLAAFVKALWAIDPSDGPEPGAHNSFRGESLANRDGNARAAILALEGVIDGDAATTAWELALETSPWEGPPVWMHGDLQSGNLLSQNGRISAVIDFGCLGVGDPSCDLAIAWNLLSPEARKTFKEESCVNENLWQRGRGWALSIALIALPYYKVTNPALAEISRYTIAEVLAEFSEGD